MQKIKTRELALCALFAALSAVLSQISIPIQPVPINLVHISVFISAGLLGAKYGALSQLVFVLMGAVGLPVFSGASGGIGKVLGPTGGYIISCIGTAFVTGFIIERVGRSSVVPMFAAMYAGWVVTYVFGTMWFIYVTQNDLMTALSWCVLPFLPGDLLKTVLSAVLVQRLSPVLGLEQEAPKMAV